MVSATWRRLTRWFLISSASRDGYATAGVKPYASLDMFTLDRIEALLDSLRGPAILKVYRPPAADLARDANASGRAELWFPGPR